MSFWEKFKIIGSKVFTFLLPFIMTFFKAYGPILLQAAADAIAVYMNDPSMSNDEKRAAQYSMIAETMKKQGYTIATGEIYDAIQVAIKGVRANAPVPPVA
jgi:hypothetical protein